MDDSKFGLPDLKIGTQTWNSKFGLPNLKIGQIPSLGTTNRVIYYLDHQDKLFVMKLLNFHQLLYKL